MLLSSLVVSLSFTVLAVARHIVVREPLITLQIVKRFNITGPRHILEADRARAAALIKRAKSKVLKSPAKKDVVSFPIENRATSYVANIGVGSPPTNYTLLVDNGSSNTWVGAGQKYVKTKTSVQTPDHVSVNYGSGSFSGIEFTDTVVVAPGLTINQQSIGVASTSKGFPDLDGILGLGPVDLTLGTLNPDSEDLIPTVTDMLFAQGVTTANEIGISFNPSNVPSEVNGELTFGGIDSSKTTGPITFVPITNTSPASEFWGIDQSITFGSASTPIMPQTAGIVDTGTTLTLLNSNAFGRYMSSTGALLDATTGLLKISPAQFGALQSLFFHIGSTTYEFTPNAQIWPRSLNALINGDASSVYLIVNNLGSPQGDGLDFINGFTFLERFYSVFDTSNRRVGFAKTANTDSEIN